MKDFCKDPPPLADYWIKQVFAAKAVSSGGVIRRSVKWVDREVGQARFIGEVRRRRFTLLQAGGQFIVICACDPIVKVV